MKKVIISFFAVVISISIYAQQQSTVTVITTNNGIGLIPAFNLNDPATLVFAKLNLGKHLEFSPDAAMNTRTGTMWFVDSWIRWNQSLDTGNRWVATVGFDYSPFFQPLEKNGETISQCVIYNAWQAKLRFFQNKKNTFTMDYWYNKTIKRDVAYGIKGSYLSLMYSREQSWEKWLAVGNTNTFFISFSDGSKGFGVSYDAMLMHKKSGIFAGAQLAHSLSARSSTRMKTNWSVSVGVTRKVF